MLDVLVWFLRIALILVSVFMVLLILMQRSKNDGLGGSLAGGMTGEFLGSSAPTVLAKMTVYCAITFFVITLTLGAITRQKLTQSAGVKEKLAELAKAAGTNRVDSLATPLTPGSNSMDLALSTNISVEAASSNSAPTDVTNAAPAKVDATNSAPVEAEASNNR